MPVEVVIWSLDHVPEVRGSVRTLIRFRQKFFKLNPLLFDLNWTFLEKRFWKLLEMVCRNFRKRFWKFPEMNNLSVVR